MSNLKLMVSVFTLLSFSVLGVHAQVPKQPSGITERQVSIILQRLERSSNRFRISLNAALVQARIDQTRPQNDISSFETAFASAVEEFRDQFNRSREGEADVRNVLQKASLVNGFMTRNRLNRTVQNNWAAVRVDLDALANALGVSWQWNRQSFPPANSDSSSRLPDGELDPLVGRLTGTFLLDPSRSDSARDKAERATRNVPENERQNVYDRIITRLESPQMLAIERRGSTVTIASSIAARVTFEADGVERQESGENGRSNRVTSTLRGEQLLVSSNGYKENDFNVTFDATESDRSLRVRRQIYSDRLTQPVVVDSVYDRTSDVARWNINDDSRSMPGNPRSDIGDFILRDETVVAVLNNDLTTKQAKAGDRFSLTVREPGQYEGAVIEGTVASVDQGGRLTGRAGLTLDFKTIRLRNGESHRFAGILTSVRATNGATINVDNEGSAQGDNQTKTTVQRTGIGTAVGAVIGAIAAEGKGAAIGAIIGAAAGAGSVYVQGQGELELPTGTELTIRAGGPR
jgi:YMGG-like Gly-zipper